MAELSAHLAWFAEQHGITASRGDSELLSNPCLEDNNGNGRIRCMFPGCSARPCTWDVTLGFHSVPEWWPVLNELARDLPAASGQWTLPVASARLAADQRTLQIDLERVRALRALLRSEFEQWIGEDSTRGTEVVVISEPLGDPVLAADCPTTRYLTERRFQLVTGLIERMAAMCGRPVVPAADFQRFRGAHQTETDPYQLLERYLSIVPGSPALVAVVDSRRPRHRLTQWCFKLIPVGPVSMDLEAADYFQRKVSPDSLISGTVELAAVLGAGRLDQPRVLRAGQLVQLMRPCTFVQYNLARMYAIRDRYERLPGGTAESVFIPELLCSDTEWQLVWTSLVRLQVLHHRLMVGLLDATPFPAGIPAQLWAAILDLCHRFSRYYRSVKIVVGGANSGLTTARAELCRQLLQHANHFLEHLYALNSARHM